MEHRGSVQQLRFDATALIAPLVDDSVGMADESPALNYERLPSWKPVAIFHNDPWIHLDLLGWIDRVSGSDVQDGTDLRADVSNK